MSTIPKHQDCADTVADTVKPDCFQDIIARLQQFWSKNGAVILQPLDMEVGAGTLHPATILRALGRKPWRAAYTQPSRRPADGRYGDNPNRLQHYYQFQVILKPDPHNLQELYLNSLEQIGINRKKHDIRFVEDDWENPTVGAAGLGWEIWCDGMEVSQFTYFQQVGGLEVRPVSGELTYGLERLAMYVLEIENVFDLPFNAPGQEHSLTYGDVFKANEKQQSAYNFKLADPDRLSRSFADCEAACQLLLERDKPEGPLPLPAYEQALKASHLFNLMDARGLVSPTARAGWIRRVRNMVKGAAMAWIEQVGE